MIHPHTNSTRVYTRKQENESLNEDRTTTPHEASFYKLVEWTADKIRCFNLACHRSLKDLRCTQEQ